MLVKGFKVNTRTIKIHFPKTLIDYDDLFQNVDMQKYNIKKIKFQLKDGSKVIRECVDGKCTVFPQEKDQRSSGLGKNFSMNTSVFMNRDINLMIFTSTNQVKVTGIKCESEVNVMEDYLETMFQQHGYNIKSTGNAVNLENTSVIFDFQDKLCLLREAYAILDCMSYVNLETDSVSFINLINNLGVKNTASVNKVKTVLKQTGKFSLVILPDLLKESSSLESHCENLLRKHKLISSFREKEQFPEKNNKYFEVSFNEQAKFVKVKYENVCVQIHRKFSCLLTSNDTIKEDKLKVISTLLNTLLNVYFQIHV
jgi:hypothetical protein